jgi:hypothetical protein
VFHRHRFIAAPGERKRFCRIINFWGHGVQSKTWAEPTLPPIGAIGIAFAVGIAYFLIARRGLCSIFLPVAAP